MPPHLLTNFEKKAYDQNKPKYKGFIYSHIPILTKHFEGCAMVMNLTKPKSVGTYR